MARRILWDRRLIPDRVYSATQEAGIEVDVPAEGAVQGRMRLEAGGSPSEAQDFDAYCLKSGNLGDAEWVIKEPSSERNEILGKCAPYIPEYPQHVDDVASLAETVRLTRDVGRRLLYMTYQANLTVKIARLDPSNRTESDAGWDAPTTVGTVINTGQGAAGYLFEDTGELVVFCDGNCFSSMDPDETTPTWITKGTASGYSGGDFPSLVYYRGKLIAIYEDANIIRYLVSYDRGATWGDETTAIGAGDLTGNASAVHCAYSHADDRLYLAVEDDTAGGLDSQIRIFKSGDGETWDEVNSDFGGFAADTVDIQDVCLMFEEDGTLITYTTIAKDGTTAPSYVQCDTSKDFGENEDLSGVMLKIFNTLTNPGSEWDGFQAIDIGTEILGVAQLNNDLISMGLRWWSSVSEQVPLDSYGWVVSGNLNPDGEFAWDSTGGGTQTLSDDYMQIQVVAADAPASLYYTGYIDATSYTDIKIRFSFRDDMNCDRANQRTGIRVECNIDGAKGYDFGVYIDEGGFSLYDHDAGAEVYDTAETLTGWWDFLIDVNYEAANTTVTIRCRPRTSLPTEWIYIYQGTVNSNNAAGPGVGLTHVDFGIHSHSGGAETMSMLTDYLFMAHDREGATSAYKNNTTDYSDLTGKVCSKYPQGAIGEIDLWWRGAGAYFEDRWDVLTRYHWAKENVFRADPKRQWRSTGDNAEVSLVFEAPSATQGWQLDWFAIFGKNFPHFYFEGDDSINFNSDGGSPEFTFLVGDGDSVDGDVLGYEAAQMEIQAGGDDWLEFDADTAVSNAFVAGRWDRDNIRGKKFWLRVLSGASEGKIYEVEGSYRGAEASVGNFMIRVGNDEDGNPPDLVTDGVEAGEYVGIFSESLAFEVQGYRPTGYRYVRIRIPAIHLPDDYYRIGTVIFGTGVTMQSGGYNEAREPEWGYVVRTLPNVASMRAPDLSDFRRRRGPAPQEILVGWSGLVSCEMLGNPISCILEAAAADCPVAFTEEDCLEHHIGSPSVVLQVSHRPMLCRVEGPIEITHQSYFYLDQTLVWEACRYLRISNMAGCILREIV